MSLSTGRGEYGIINEVFNAGIRLPFDGNLHEFQIEDLNKFGRRKKCGYFLDVGLGKTVLGALTAAYHLLNGFDHAIVICPASLINQWTEALKKMNFDVIAYVGTPTQRRVLHFAHDFVVMSYQIFQKDYDRIKNLKSYYYVIDEATVLCDTNNRIWKMLNGGIIKKKVSVPGQVKPRVDVKMYNNINKGCCLLTATPSNKPSDLYGLIATLDPSIYVNKFQFDRLHVSETDYFGAPSSFVNLEMLKANLDSVASIRFASDHLDLPDKVTNVIEYDLDPDHMELYKQLMEERLIVYKGKVIIDALQATALYNAAQRIITNPDMAMYKKDPKGLELLDTVVRNNPSTLIVNKYTITNDNIMGRYKDIGIGGCYGKITRQQQTKHIEDFKAGKLRVLTVHAKSAGVGLNLQSSCSNVVFLELPMTARDMHQAIGRVYRQGQQSRVIVTIFIARRTIQHTLLKRILETEDLNNQVLNSPDSLRKDLFPDG